MSTRLESGERTGWLYNYRPVTEVHRDDDHAGPSNKDDGGVEGAEASQSALTLLFQDLAGELFHVNIAFDPYFLLLAAEGHEREVELGLLSMFGAPLIKQIVLIEKEDLDLLNHLSGRKRVYLQVSFSNVNDLTVVRGQVEKMVRRNAAGTSDNPLFNPFQGSLSDAMARSVVDDDEGGHWSALLGGRTGGNNSNSNGGGGSGSASAAHHGSGSRWTDWVQDMREYDVKYYMRVAIDRRIFCGLWYDVAVHEGETLVSRCDDSKYAPAMPRVVAFDIETTKAPLRFPQPEVDQIYMISYMLDGRGYLITNREIVSADIAPFEYTPRPEYEGFFETFNEPDEARTLRRFFDEMKKFQPNVYVTYNGDYFDFPFIHARALVRGMSVRDELGFYQGADSAFLHPTIPHLDCFYWVKRDSYLPQGSQGLKAVTRYKLGFDPIEVDAEDMLPLAQSDPQRMASYSVSDAVSTWYLYMKYIHQFIFSLATIIPMPPNDVLRKGSGGLCEALLMVQAEANHVVFPNKKELIREKFHEGHLIDSETYIGGRVEALRSGVYRSDLPLDFDTNPDTYQGMLDDLDEALKFAVEVENGLRMEDVTNYDEVRQAIARALEQLRDCPRRSEHPLIYHLDVGAMYPNIILTNRLQPYAIASADVCAACCFNTPDNAHKCKRVMSWKWRGELFTASRYEYQRVKAQLENESFATAAIEQANLASVTRKGGYGQRKGSVLEGTVYEKRTDWKSSGSRGGGGSNYRRESYAQRKEAAAARLPAAATTSTTTTTTAHAHPSKSAAVSLHRPHHSRNPTGGHRSDEEDEDDEDAEDDEDGGGHRAYLKLNENTQFNMLKRRLAEYSRRAYGKVHESREIVRSNVVCQRENAFYVDTVRLFRDRRYEYKAALKKWKGRLDAATTPQEVKLCQSRCVQMESLQLAHKCILNSFYGYVMRKGSRWSSMEMAGIVTYLGASLIQMARALVQQIGVTLELDTDGIWCCLPGSFPENFTLTTRSPKKPKLTLSYPCVLLNKMVHDRYCNHQYQSQLRPGEYVMRSECSIYFEVDGPYRAMLLPASREEGKSIKKRYAVFHPDGRLAELKGFELKRRGELTLIKDFQSQVFSRFLDGSSVIEAYASAATVANAALDMLASRGEGYDTEEVLEKISESSNMTRRLSEYPDSQKSLAITTAKRIAEFLGPQMVKDKGLACHFVISRAPVGRPVTERAIPVTIFRAEAAVRTHFLRRWTADPSVSSTLDLRALLDWDYYTARFAACVQKIITIPAALQSVGNPVPRVGHPDWLERRVQQQNSRYRQRTLTSMLHNRMAADETTQQKQMPQKPRQTPEDDAEGVSRTSTGGPVSEEDTRQITATVTRLNSNEEHKESDSMRCNVSSLTAEPVVGAPDSHTSAPAELSSPTASASTSAVVHRIDVDMDDVDDEDDDDDVSSVCSETEEDRVLRERAEAREAEKEALHARYFGARSMCPLDDSFVSHRGFARWLGGQRQSWLHRAQLRRQLQRTCGEAAAAAPGAAIGGRVASLTSTLTSAASASVSAAAMDTTSRVMTMPWEVLEVRESATDSDTLIVLAVIDGVGHTLHVSVPREVLVDVDGSAAPPDGVAAGARTLPRHRPCGTLYTVALPPGTAGERRLGELQVMDHVRGVYEAHRTRVHTFIERAGCCAVVRVPDYLAHMAAAPNTRAGDGSRRSSSSATTGSRLVEDIPLHVLERAATGHYLARVVEPHHTASLFLYHTTSSGNDTRAVLALVNARHASATVVFVQPSAAARPVLRWTELCEEEAQRAAAAAQPSRTAEASTVAPPPPKRLQLQLTSDITTGWRIIYRALIHAMEDDDAEAALHNSSGNNKPPSAPLLPASLPLLAVLHSTHSTAALISQQALPAGVAYLRTLGAAEDEALFADPFRWPRLHARRVLQRYYAAHRWVHERTQLSRLSGIPLCNVRHDGAVHALDVLYTRALHRRGHVLWCAADPALALDTVEERRRRVGVSGGYATWCVELSLSRLEVVAILFAQTIQEGDDPGAAVLCDRGVSSHFNILRDVVADLLSRAVQCRVADGLLRAVSRWLHDPAAACFEPRLVEWVSALALRALTSVLLRLAKLGARTVMVGSRSVVVQTPKYHLSEALNYVHYMTQSVQEEPMLILLAMRPVRFWCPLIVVDTYDYAGLYVTASGAAAATSAMPSMPMQFGFVLTRGGGGRLPAAVSRVLVDRVGDVLHRVHALIAAVRCEVDADASVMLAMRIDAVTSRVLVRMRQLFEQELPPLVMEEVQRVADGKSIYPEGRAAGREGEGVVNGSSGGKAVHTAASGLGVSVALEYAKLLCQVLDRLPAGGAVSKLRNNCMRLCGVSPFSPHAQLSPDPWMNCHRQDLVCPFCNHAVVMDLSVRRNGGAGARPGVPLLHTQASHGSPVGGNVSGSSSANAAAVAAALAASAVGFECPECRMCIHPVAMEAHLVRQLNRCVWQYIQGDFVCAKCKEMSANLLCDNCCGPLVMKAGELAQSTVRALQQIALIQGFEWLRESTEAAMEYVC